MYGFPMIIVKHLARDRATFTRRGLVTKPKLNVVSAEIYLLSERTMLIMITLYSCPWNSSTDPIFGYSNSACKNNVRKYFT